MEISDSKKYEGRIYEAKENFLVETPIGENSVSIQHIGDFINSILGEFNNRNVEIEVSINIKDKEE
jgi:hypothetical protein